MNQIQNLIDINENPFVLFNKWYLEAKKKEINDPNAMTLSTISDQMLPSSRVVLLKSYDLEGFVFYTNINSRKGLAIKKNKYVALNFHWKSLFKQIRIEGVAKKISKKDADKYFISRPLKSRIGAWASNQSSILKNRKELEDKIKFYNMKFKRKIIPRPTFWTGFKVEPNLIEFWQDRPFRLHDRVEFNKIRNKWSSKRLYP